MENTSKFGHLTADRAWKLIGDHRELEPQEIEHVRSCEDCHEFLATFLHLARIAGFHVTFELPGNIQNKKPA
jgi:hypothetical protein